MAIANSILTLPELKAHMDYDPITGVFTRLNTIHGNPCRREIKGNNCNGYTVFEVCGRKEYAHRMAWLWSYGIQPMYGIDHINGVKTDNRICNLRDVPQQVNMQNRKLVRLNPESSLRGVRPGKGADRWSARITVSRKEINLGTFDSKDAAYKAYLTAKRARHAGCTI